VPGRRFTDSAVHLRTRLTTTLTTEGQSKGFQNGSHSLHWALRRREDMETVPGQGAVKII
jgi:hypothetical protein